MKHLATPLPLRVSANGKILILAVLVTVSLPFIYRWITISHDWDDWNAYFRPATLAMLSGRSPYGSGFYNAPWSLLPFIPIALLPYPVSRFAFFLLSTAGFAYLIRSLTNNPLSIILFMTSVPVVFCLNDGTLDWITMLGFVAPAPFALILASIKPQIGAGIAVFWLVESWRKGGARLVFWNFLPVILLLTASFIFYGPWILNVSILMDINWNLSIFPYTIPVGLYLLIVSIVRRDPRPAMASGILLSPYFTIATFSPLLIALLETPKILMLAWLILWAGIIALISF